MNIIQPPHTKSPLPNTSNHYVNNKELYTAFVEYKKKYNHAVENNLTLPRIPNYIGECILKIATGLSTKYNFALYPYREEMISDGIENCLDGDTKILTIEHGPIEISKIIGQEVTIKCGDGIWRKSVAKHFGKQKMFRYWFGRHNQHLENLKLFVDATENHRWYVSSRLGKRNLREHVNGCITDLRVGDDLMKTPYIDGIDDWSVIHGIIFGDGSGHKKYQSNDDLLTEQGNKYCTLRVCKQDKVKDEICERIEKYGYKPTYPPHAKGDPIYHLGKEKFIKDIPYTIDPSYIRGFIYGWWLADGAKTVKNEKIWQISTVNKEAVDWIINYASYGGYTLANIRRVIYPENGGEKNHHKFQKINGDKPNDLYIITLYDHEDFTAKVKKIEYIGEKEVYCFEEPITNSFVLANGLLTGNCFMYINNFDPDKYTNPFAYFTQIIMFAFIRRIQKEKKQLYIKHKITEQQIYSNLRAEIPSELVDDTFVNSYEDMLTEKRNKAKERIKKTNPPKKVVDTGYEDCV